MEETSTQASEASRKSKRTRIQDYESDDDEIVLPEPQVDTGDITQRDTITAAQRPSTHSEPMDTAVPAHISSDRLKIFKNGLQKAFRDARDQSSSLANIIAFIDQNSGDIAFTDAEITAAVEKMTDDNQIMVADDMVFLI